MDNLEGKSLIEILNALAQQLAAAREADNEFDSQFYERKMSGGDEGRSWALFEAKDRASDRLKRCLFTAIWYAEAGEDAPWYAMNEWTPIIQNMDPIRVSCDLDVWFAQGRYESA